ncbi:MAG: hypothetical protein AABZ44_00790, partial [Elusimicrobiota bacterium]
MEAFRTPLFKILTSYIFILLVARQMGYLKVAGGPVTRLQSTPGWHLLDCRLGAPLARGFEAHVSSVDGRPAQAMAYVRFADP